MADLTDQAQERDAQQLAHALATQRARAAAEPLLDANGECQNPACGLPVAHVVLDGEARMPLFCGPACAKESKMFLK